ncbi:ATP-binding cassette domain-containing protein [Mycoplasmatota bacterium WC44]
MKLILDHVMKNYDIKILKDLSIRLDGYKSVAIIGASGSGKSTLLRLLSGIEFPDSGKIIVNNHNITKESVKEYQINVGFVFQKHNLFPHLTLKKNISLILEKTRGIELDEAERIAEKYLSELHLTDQMHKLPRHVSGGQSQRASLARALSINPEILFLDEPTASLDPILTYEVLESIKRLKGIGKDFVFVTHEISFVRDFADYVFFMNDGQIIEHGDPSILDNPKSRVFKDFMLKVR